MASYLYCVLRPPKREAVPPELRGIGATEVRSLSSPALDPLEAWVATVPEAALRLTDQQRAVQALLHNKILNAALATGRTPVPARFGVIFPDDAGCEQILVARREELLHTLERIADAVESSVLIVPRERALIMPRRPSRNEAGAGRRYLEAVRERARAEASRDLIVNADADRISEAVGRVVRAEERNLDSRGILSLVHLVSRDALDDYRTLIASVKADSALRIVLGSVRAPYSFAELNRANTGHDSSSPSHNG